MCEVCHLEHSLTWTCVTLHNELSVITLFCLFYIKLFSESKFSGFLGSETHSLIEKLESKI